jgi:SAM-dependent methyltransferase
MRGVASDAGAFDQWYSDMGRSALRAQIVGRALGLPLEVDSSSLLPWTGLAEVVAALAPAPGRLVVDLGCGRGGYGLEAARRTGARLIGVDFSAVAVAAAARSAGQFGLGGRVGFCLGNLTATGLRSGSADAVMCIDAIQFADPPLAGLRECRRILGAGGRLAVTCWEPVGPPDERLPARLRRVDLARDLAAAGFESIEVLDKSAWRDDERALWESALRSGAARDPAIRSLQQEATRVLGWFDSARRVSGTATAPQLH